MGVWPEENGVIDTIIEAGSGVEFRRIRIFHAGQIYNNIKYKLQFDFAGGSALLKDAYIMITKIPIVGNLQVGHFKEPIGLELLASSKFISLMERGLTDPLTPERNTGLMAFNNILNKRMSWAIGYFVPADNFGAYYAYATWTITGESRKYKLSATTFDRLKPKRNFGKDGGAGAWEIALRYSESMLMKLIFWAETSLTSLPVSIGT